MNTSQSRKLKLYTVAILLGAGLAIHLSHSVVKAQSIAVVEKPWKVTRHNITEVVMAKSAIIAQVERVYTQGKYAGNEYAQYIWDKWAPHGNRAQAVALCTNIAEGHLDDSATGVNSDSSVDSGCWQYNSVHNLPDSLTRNCKAATDYTYAIWLKRVGMGIQDGFQGMWYGYGSPNYEKCLNDLTK